MQFDLHIHTRYSFDSNMRPEKVVQVARARGLDGIAITDHNTIEGAIEALRYASDDLMVIVGEEIGTSSGEITGLFLKEPILTNDAMEVIQQIHAQGGLAFLPHPFARRLTIEERVAKALDGCEGFNSRHSRVKILNNTYGESHIFEFAKIYDLTLIAGSDAHFYREIGRARTIIPAGSLEEVKEVLQMGNTALMGRHSSVLNMLNSVMVGLVKRFFFPMPQSKSSLSNTVR